MASAPYILARTMKEAHVFARESLGLPYGGYRIVNSPSTIKSVRGVRLYLVPGHESRFDRFGMKGAIRWTRMEVWDVAEKGLPGGEDPRGALTDDVLETAYAENAVRSGLGAPGISTSTDGLNPPGVQMAFDDLFSNVADTSNGGNMVAEGGPADPEPAPAEPAKKPGRRRRRCKDCGELHYKEDPCATNDESA